MGEQRREETKLGDDSSSPTGRWQEFRRLCHYYADCVRASERPSVKFSPDQEGKKYLTLPANPDFHRLARGETISIPVRSDSSKLLEALRKRKVDARLMIGSPLLRTDEEVVPVFIIETLPRLERGRLLLTPLSTVRANVGWLDRKEITGKKSEAQALLLEIVGIDESQREETNLAEVAQRLREHRPELWTRWKDPRGTWCSPLTDETIVGLSPELRFHKSLVIELREIARRSDEELDQTALAAVYPHERSLDAQRDPADGSSEEEPSMELVELAPLNPEQRRATRSSLRNGVTVLTGPPGTGKSQVVQHTLLNHLFRGQTALFASKNHAAIDAVVPRLNRLTDPDPLVIRPGAKGAKTFNWKTFVSDLLSRPGDSRIQYQLRESREELQGTLEERALTGRRVLELLELRERYGALNEERSRFEPIDLELLERCRKNRSPLKATELQEWLDHSQRGDRERSSAGWRRWLDRLIDWFEAHKPRSRKLGRFLLEVGVGEPLHRVSAESLGRVIAHLRVLEIDEELARLERQLRDVPAIGERTVALERSEQAHQQRLRSWLETAARAAGSNLPQPAVTAFQNIKAAIADAGGKIEPEKLGRQVTKQLKRVFEDILSHYPLWAVSNLSARSSLPLAPGIFDAVVIDEASQCDVPSTIPLLFRARRALISGDPLQLKPILSLSKTAERQFREQKSLGDLARWGRFLFTQSSCFDVARSTESLDRSRQLVDLRSHYRCHDAIIAYSNRLFYRGSLRVRTNADALRRPKRGHLGIVWSDVRGSVQRRGTSSFAPSLTEAIVQELGRLEKEGFEGEVGVLSPFRAQVNEISDQAHQRLQKSTLNRWHFAAATADGFQGGERDLILLALVGEPGWTSRFYSSDPNRFNVAVTRARAVLHVFGDGEWAQNSRDETVRKLYEAAREQEGRGDYDPRPELIGPVWEPALGKALLAEGIEWSSQYPACGYRLDFAIFTRKRKINIEVDGETYHRDPDGALREEDVHRDSLLRAAGWSIQRFWVYELREDMQRCVARVLEMMHEE
ncbi:MAG: AAA domain-containing protein [Planctomycetota bacterium]